MKKHIISCLAAMGLAAASIGPAQAQIDSVDPDLAMQTHDGAPVDDSVYSGDGSITDSSDGPAQFDISFETLANIAHVVNRLVAVDEAEARIFGIFLLRE